jgi:NADPH-dependent curcumin reductase CurA
MAEVKVDESRWQILYKQAPEPMVTEDCFEISSYPADSIKALEDGQVLVKVTHISVDPYMRGRMNKTSYGQVWNIGQPCTGGLAGVVVESKSNDFAVGDKVTGFGPWRAQIAAPAQYFKKLPDQSLSPSLFLGGLGMPGNSAYLPFKKFSKIKAGDVVFVSGAAGAVGSIFGQLAKNAGATVYGSAGSDDKITLLKELGFDDATNYKKESPADGLDRMLGGKKIDCYFDNVGGETLDAVFPRMNLHGRIICCGMISQYNLKAEDKYGLKNVSHIVSSRLSLNGFIVSDWASEMEQATTDLIELVAAGKLRPVETIVEGYQNIPKTFVALFQGENKGKMVVKVADS